jgi:SHS2 domain-containing protein
MTAVTTIMAAGGRGGADPRGAPMHVALPHTADAGFMAAASDLPALFQESAVALAEIAAEIAPGTEASIGHDVSLEADDLPSLAYAWLNELIALADINHAAVVSTRVMGVDSHAADKAVGSWSLRARVGLRPYAAGGVRVLREPKSATYHGLVVERTGACWTLRAYLDL